MPSPVPSVRLTPAAVPAKPLGGETKPKEDKPPTTSPASPPTTTNPWRGTGAASNSNNPVPTQPSTTPASNPSNSGGVGYWLTQGQRLLGGSGGAAPAQPASPVAPAPRTVNPSGDGSNVRGSGTSSIAPTTTTTTPATARPTLLDQAKGLLLGSSNEPKPQPKDLKAAKVIGQTGEVHQSTSPDGKTTRERVYVLHSGMNDPTNTVALRMRQELLGRNIPDERILILSNRYPSFDREGGTMDNFRQFGRFADPKAKDSGEAYDEMHEAIKARGFDPAKVAVTMIAHSGGGQAALGMAEVDKVKTTPQIERVVTLGSPLARNGADPKVALTHFISDEDPIHYYATSSVAKLAGGFYYGRTPREFPTNLDANDQVVRTTNLDHHGYFTHKPTMDRVADAAVGRPLRTPAAAVLPFFAGSAAFAFDGSKPLQTNAREFNFTGPKEVPTLMGSLMKHIGY
jgi:pimeloyl-ACP methyl ester carboxylesterase